MVWSCGDRVVGFSGMDERRFGQEALIRTEHSTDDAYAHNFYEYS